MKLLLNKVDYQKWKWITGVMYYLNIGLQKVKFKLSLSMPWRFIGGSSIASLILNLSIKWRWVVNIMPQQLYPQYRTWYTLNWAWVVPKIQSGCSGEENLSLLGFEPQAVQSQSSDSNYTVLEQGVKDTSKYMYLLDCASRVIWCHEI